MMNLREPASPGMRSGHVVHGPFPVRGSALGVALACLFLGPLLFFLASLSQHLVCAGGGEVRAMCTFEQQTFPRDELRGARVTIERGSKGARYGVVHLDRGEGRDLTMMQVSPEDAQEAAQAINAALATRAPIDVSLHQPRVFFAIGIALILAGFFAGSIALSRMGRFDLRVVHDGAALRVRRSLFGVPLGSRDVSLEGVVQVTVERGTIDSQWRSRGELPIPIGRLVLVYRQHDARPLSDRSFPGVAIHLRAAAALRDVLRLEPDLNDDTDLAAMPMRVTPLATRLGFAWAGLTTGSLLGLAAAALGAIGLGLATMRSNFDGAVMAAGMIPGACAGVALVFYLTRPRPPL